MQEIYWFDIFILGFTLLLGLKGVIDGLIKEVFGLIGIIGGVIFASRYSQEAANFISNNLYKIENESLALFAGFLIILVVFWIVCISLGSIISKLLKISGLGIFDRIGGFIFGSAKIFLVFSILVFCVSKIEFLNIKLENYTKDSFVYPMLKQTGSFIMNQEITIKSVDKISEEIKDLKSDFNKTQG